MVSLPQPCPKCSEPVMNYSGWCAACGYKPEARMAETGLVDRAREAALLYARHGLKELFTKLADAISTCEGTFAALQQAHHSLAQKLAAKEAECVELRRLIDAIAKMREPHSGARETCPICLARDAIRAKAALTTGGELDK